MEKNGNLNLSGVDASIFAEAAKREHVVVAVVPHGYETNINVRIVPGGEFVLAPRGCQPRKGAPRRIAEPLDLPPDLVDKLKVADKKVTGQLRPSSRRA